MAVALLHSRRSLKAVASCAKQFGNFLRARLVATRFQLPGKDSSALDGPTKRGFGIAPRQRGYESMQRLDQLRVLFLERVSTRTATPFFDEIFRRSCPTKLVAAFAYCADRHSRRRCNQRNAAISNRLGLRASPKSPAPLSQGRGKRTELSLHDVTLVHERRRSRPDQRVDPARSTYWRTSPSRAPKS